MRHSSPRRAAAPIRGVAPFGRVGDAFRDEETGSTWNVFGEAVDGPLQGEALEPVAHIDTFWFAWGVFKPDTRIEP